MRKLLRWINPRPSWDTMLVLDRLQQMEDLIMTTAAEIKAAFDSYQADVQKAIDASKADVQAAVDKALADDELKDSEAMQELAASIKTAHDKLVPPEQPAAFQPSNN